jgi:hypothetical protein
MRKSIKKLSDIRDRCIIDGSMWIWSDGVNSSGSPLCRQGAKTVTVLRLAYEMKNGPVDKNARVWSMSRNRLDVNPANAMTGTIAEHMRFLSEDGRRKGIKHCIASTKARDKIGRRFTPDEIREIRQSNETEAALAKKHSVSASLIGHIRRNRIYRSLGAANASVFNFVGWA